MTLRWKLILYLVAVHAAFSGACVWFLRHDRVWLLAVEAAVVLSAAVGITVVRSIFGPLDLIRTGVQFLKESDFNSRLKPVGQPEVDELTGVYNRMVDHLREERIRLREQQYFLAEIIKASPSGIVIFDFDGRISEVNPAAERLLGETAEALAGWRLAELAAPLAAGLEALTAGSSAVLPLEGNRRVKASASQFLDRGFPRRFLLVEELTEELRRAEKAAYEKIIRLMSHEVNNTVGATASLLESALNYQTQVEEADRQDYVMALTVAIERARSLNAFVRSYADVIRLPQPELRPVDLQKLLEELAFVLRAETASRRIRWRWEIEDGLAPAAMDKNQMEQVFLNVLKNAAEAIGEDGEIVVRMGVAAGRTFVSIQDSGPGIPPEVRAQLFTPFFSTKQNGRGIGLTLVQEILTQHGFRFALESPPTRFTVWF